MKDITRDKIILNNNAHQKFATRKPGTIAAASIISKALITKVNKPRVTALIGKVKSNSIGLINAFSRPITKATSRALTKPETVIPGNR